MNITNEELAATLDVITQDYDLHRGDHKIVTEAATRLRAGEEWEKQARILRDRVQELEELIGRLTLAPQQVDEGMVELAKHKNWSLGFHDKVYGDDDDLPTHGHWVVWEETGNINDREWRVVSFGETPQAALTAALTPRATNETEAG